MSESYFGAYGEATRRRSEAWFELDWDGCADCLRECDRKCALLAGIPFDRIGGFFFEPGSASGMVRFPPEKLIRAIVSEVHANNGYILVNEVTTGFGRTGKWFGYQHYGITPDIVSMGKGMGNGYPVSATVVSPGLAARLASAPVNYAQSHQNDPLGAAVALEVIRVIREEELIDRGERMGAVLVQGLKAARRRTGKIKEIRARGLMAAVELEDDAQATFTTRVHQRLFQNGYVLARRPGLNVLRLDPSLTVEKEDIEGFLQAFEGVLTEKAECSH